MGWDQFDAAVKMRDLFTRIAEDTVERMRPQYRYATVKSIGTSTATVQFPGEDSEVTVGMGAIRPSAINQRVRIHGIQGERYIADVMGPPYIEPVPSAWIELGGWLNGSSPYQTGLGNSWTPRIRKIGQVVYMAGLFHSGATTNPLHVNTLPAGYRPATGETMLAIPHAGTGIRRMDVASTGAMILREQFAGAATTGWHSLHNSFIAEG